MYIHDKTKPFPWKLRISFATDIARALAYLHARKCIHRDLKGENLLVTANGRLKITDFGFARIAARNAEESKRLTFCGTDAYMSPEILLGNEFGLATDIFSMGIILCEMGARKLADDYTFKRSAPTFGIDEGEVRQLLSEKNGCPTAFTQLAIDCLLVDPLNRPDILSILSRLRDIELEVLARPSEADDVHVGSVKFMVGNKRPGAAPRIPSFGMGVAQEVGKNGKKEGSSSSDEGDTDEELMAAIKKLDVGCEFNSFILSSPALTVYSVDGTSQQALLGDNEEIESTKSEYSTTVIRSHSPQASTPIQPSLSSILTIRTPQPTDADTMRMPAAASIMSIDSFHTAASTISIAAATEGSSITDGTSTIKAGSTPKTFIHRFTLIKPGARRQTPGGARTPGSPVKGATTSDNGGEPSSPGSDGQIWSPFGFFFSSALAAKCDMCGKRLGFKPVLECDDCGLR